MIREALDSYAKSSAREFAHDRAQTVGASEVGQCVRKVYWTKNADDPAHRAAPDDDFIDGWGPRVRGQVFEDHFWVPAMRAKFGNSLKFAGKDQRTVAAGFLSATPDGLVVTDSECFLIECKTIDPRSKLNGPKPEHAFQVQAQLGLIREVTKHEPTHAILSYTDTSFWNEVVEFRIEFDPAIYAAAKRRAAKIATALRFAELAPEGWIAGGRECEWCPFTKACGRERTRVPEQGNGIDPQRAAEIVDLAREVKHLEQRAEAGAAALREAQSNLKKRLQDRGVRRVEFDGVRVTWSPVKGRESYDTRAIREAAVAAGVDVEQFCTVGEPTDRLIIQVRKPTSKQEHEACQSSKIS